MKQFLTQTCLLAIFALILNSAHAKKVEPADARKAGERFFKEKVASSQGIPSDQLQIVGTFTEVFNQQPVYYVFNFNTSGFVVVSGDDAVTPVLAYSTEGNYAEENQPPQFIAWMEGYAKQIDQSIRNNMQASESTKSEWSRLLSGSSDYTPKRVTTDVAPLLISTWDQGSFYNDLCPADAAGPGGKVWAGCVSTAMSQVMYYYRWPQTGLGYHCYNPAGYATQCADFGNTTYKWNEMVNSVTFHDTAVATLLWHGGISVDMMYSPTGSGAYSDDAVAAMINNFKYHPNSELVYKDNYSETDWASLLKENIDNGRPMYYHGFGSGGHAFNVDGYQGTDYFHFNWGWSGSYNGYYYLNNLNPGGNNFTYGQGAIINLYPDTTNYSYPSYCPGTVTLSTLKGTFEDGSGPIRDYQNNANCSYLIAPVSSSDSIDYITITFNRFNTESGMDVVKIYKGGSTSDSLVATLSGSNLPSAVVVYSNKALVTFTSNASGTSSGWFASYTAHSMEFCHGTTTLTTNQGTLTDGSMYFNYKNLTVCRTKILPDNNGPVTFTFTSFKTESGMDVVKIYDLGTEELLGTYSGHYESSGMPAAVTAYSGQMYIMFSTNNTVNDLGWEGTYSTYPVGAEEKGQTSSFQVYPNPASENINVSYVAITKEQLQLELLDLGGTCLYSCTIAIDKGMNQMLVPVDTYAPGVYLLRLTTGNETVVKKVVIR